MDTKKLYALTLKFKRHNINFNYDEATNAIEIGEALKLKRKLVTGIVAIAIAILLLLIIVFLQLPFGRIINFILVPPIGIYGLKEIGNYITLSKGNKDNKIITPSTITIANKKDINAYLKNEISAIDYRIKREEQLHSEGTIFITCNEKDIPLLKITDEEDRLLEKDLIFLKDFLNEYMGV